MINGKHVVFGKVIDGLLVMRKIENVPTGANNKPKISVVISQCGQMCDKDKSESLTDAEIAAWIYGRSLQQVTQILRDNLITFTSVLDMDPRDGMVSWGEYVAYFLKERKINLKEKDPEKVMDLLNRTLKEELMMEKASWYEAARGDPDALNIDEFLSFRHPEQSHSLLLQVVDNVASGLDFDGDGMLSLEEFLALKLEDLGTENAKIQALFSGDLKETFKVMDTSGDGSLSRREVLEYVDPRNRAHSLRVAKWLVKQADENQDGVLSFQEGRHFVFQSRDDTAIPVITGSSSNNCERFTRTSMVNVPLDTFERSVIYHCRHEDFKVLESPKQMIHSMQPKAESRGRVQWIAEEATNATDPVKLIPASSGLDVMDAMCMLGQAEPFSIERRARGPQILSGGSGGGGWAELLD
ncbi:unnamed protein product [Darwinula stevensoni]|uniref:Peptidylprolyl isomerase n=1 Tax=Darwinula stevensoni TaxID=69355 RepID=A0A7R8XA00_9CRUS|nr:unnamed protein product [Darwinula stevensoni]CAG0886183.1 unnamed protein product [Darwinula stevensoni]